MTRLKTTLLRYSTLAYRAVLLGCMGAVLYLQNHYVAKEVYEADKTIILKAQQTMRELFVQMEERNKVNDRQDSTLLDHEARLRTLEKRTNTPR